MKTKPTYPITLVKDEIILETWKPDIKNFYLATGVKSIATFIFLNPAFMFITGTSTIIGFIIFLLILILSMFALSFIFDDFGDWRKNKFRTWFLTNKRFISINALDENENISIEISKIRKISIFFFWRLFIRPHGFGVIEMAYVKNLRSVRKRILDLRDGFTPKETTQC